MTVETEMDSVTPLMTSGMDPDTKKKFVEELQGHLKSVKEGVKTANHTHKDNGAEGLLSLGKWIHEAKSTERTKEAVRALVENNGVDVLVNCMAQNSKDTIVATRVLEIIAGEDSSNSSLPLLVDSAARGMLIQLGFAKVLLGVMDLPDLQSVARGLGCRALRELATDKTVLQAIVEGNGVELLMQQVIHVDRPFAFGALAILSRRNNDARDQIRKGERLSQLLRKFSEHPSRYNTPEDPAAALLFLVTWSWSEISEQLHSIYCHKVGEDMSEHEVYNVLQAWYSKRYHSYNHLVDISLTTISLCSNVLAAKTYWQEGKTEFSAIVMTGLILVAVLTTHAMMAKNPPKWKMLLNILTLGAWSIEDEVRISAARGFRTEEVLGLKMFMIIQSFNSFFVGIYSIVISNYIDGYPPIHPYGLAVRWASIASALIGLPKTIGDIVRGRLVFGKKEFGKTYQRRSHETLFKVLLLVYQGSEVWSLASILIFEVAARPNTKAEEVAGIEAKLPLIILMGSHALLLVLVFLIGARGRGGTAALVPIMICLICQISSGRNSDLQLITRASVVLRLLNLFVCWAVISKMLLDKPELEDHILSTDDLGLLAIAAGGTVVHFFSTMQQFVAGRWKFDLHGDVDQGGRHPTLHSGHTGAVGGVYESSAHAPAMVLERWKQVHELLPDATARVHQDAFVKVHKTIHEDEFTKDPHFEAFLTALFTAGTGLMLPKQKADLGKHCFGYTSLVSNEYCNGRTASDGLGLLSAPAIGWFDPLASLRVELNEDWVNVQKDADGHVTFDAFKKILLKRHEPKFGGRGHEPIAEVQEAYEAFLQRLFEAARLLSGPNTKNIDRHSFVYASLLSYEFYFSDARDRDLAQGCGSSTPVADNLGITRA